MKKVVVPAPIRMVEDGIIDAKDNGTFKFSITNEGSTNLRIGVRGQGKPFLVIPPKPDGSPAFPRVWDTGDTHIPFGVDFEVQFDDGQGMADIILFKLSGLDGHTIKEILPS